MQHSQHGLFDTPLYWIDQLKEKGPIIQSGVDWIPTFLVSKCWI